MRPSPTIRSSSSLSSRILVSLVLLSCGLQLIGLYRPSGPPTPDAIPHLDKVAHVVIFALPVALILLWRSVSTGRRPSRALVAGVIVGFTAHAVISELIQGLVLPDRSGDPFDVLADVVGIAVGYGTAVLIVRRRTGEHR